jgi:phospholipase D3/4
MSVLESHIFVTVTAASQGKPIPFTRVDHSKFIVTDSLTYITTSNWYASFFFLCFRLCVSDSRPLISAADYFLTTGGVSITFMNENVRQEGEQIFLRDWEGPYSGAIPAWSHSPRAATPTAN